MYDWKYCSLGGVVRVNIATGEDIAHLGELDQKLWTVLSCPTKGLEFDTCTLKYLDSDSDGKIRVDEVVAAADWISSVVTDKEVLVKGADSLPLDLFRQDVPEGKKLYDSARMVLSNLGLDKNEIGLRDIADKAAVLSNALLNGDGIVVPDSIADEDLKNTVSACVETMGGVDDSSGKKGVDAARVEAFYAALEDWFAWQAAGKDPMVRPFGDDTEAAFNACEALKEKLDDYFLRCKLIAFDEACAPVLDVSPERIAAISGDSLASKTDAIASYPLARPRKESVLPFDGINPAWQAAFANLKALVFDVKLAGKNGVTEAEWREILASFGGYCAWKAAAKGEAAAALGCEKVEAILSAGRKADILAIIVEDKSHAGEVASVNELDKFLHYLRDFYKFLNNYVIFKDFYSLDPSHKAVFEAGKLYIDQRCCELCIRVDDMGKHADMAGLSGMFLIYCTCTSRAGGATMNIVAVMTDGGVSNLRVGTNAIFYDRAGGDWDAVVTKIVDNPISLKQAFWSPYRKFAGTISERITKSVAEKESKVSADVVSSVNSLSVPSKPEDAKTPSAPALPKASFDIAKFAGVFAAIGMAVAYLTTALAKLVTPWYNVLIVLGVLVFCVSGPSMFLAWQKLRRRNLGPVLNANGWAINSVVLVNIVFGGTLTSVAKYPKIRIIDPFREKGHAGRNVVIALILLAGVFAALYFTGHLACIGLAK